MTGFLPLFSAQPEAGSTLQRTVSLLAELLLQAGKLQQQLGIVVSVETIRSIGKLIQTAESLELAPDASPEAFAASIWDHGIEQVADLADAAASLEPKPGGRCEPLCRRSLGYGTRPGSSGARKPRHEFTALGFRQVANGRSPGAVLSGGPQAAAVRAASTPRPPCLRKKARAVLQAGDFFGRQAFASFLAWRSFRVRSAFPRWSPGCAALAALVLKPG